MAVVAEVRLTLAPVATNPPGPDQLYVAPLTVLVVSVKVFPAHTGPLFPAVTEILIGVTEITLLVEAGTLPELTILR